MSEEKKKEEAEISRRDFIKSAGLVAGSVAIGSTALIAAAPAPQAATPAAQGTVYAAVSPLGQSTVALVRPNPPIADLKGKVVGFVDVEFGGMRSQTFMRAMEALAVERIPGVKVIELPSNQGGLWHSRPQDGTTGQVAKAAKCDAVIVGIGG